MKIHVFEKSLWLPKDRDETFAFFSDVRNLDAITPPWLNFRIVTPLPVEMKPGALIDYRLRVRFVPMKWRTEIVEWSPPTRFVDRQLIGPYRQWVHTHTFEPENGGTRMTDHVAYAVPGGPLASLVDRWFVRPDIERIFAYRACRIGELLNVAP